MGIGELDVGTNVAVVRAVVVEATVGADDEMTDETEDPLDPLSVEVAELTAAVDESCARTMVRRASTESHAGDVRARASMMTMAGLGVCVEKEMEGRDGLVDAGLIRKGKSGGKGKGVCLSVGSEGQ